DAIGPDRVHVVLMPSRYSSENSVSDAEDLAKRQGLHARTVPIGGVVDAFNSVVEGLTGLAAENLQARIRGVTLMALSNQEGHLGGAPRADTQRGGPCGAAHGEKERDPPGLLPPVRRLGRRFRANKGRAKIAGRGAGEVAQPPGRAGRPAPADPGELDLQAAQ